MATYSVTGQDTLQINGVTCTDFADDDIVTLEFPNDTATVKVGKNGNALFADNATGQMGTLVATIIRGSAFDKFLNSLQAAQRNNFAAFILLTGVFIKNVGDGQGNLTRDKYNLQGGVFSKNINTKSNVAGDTDQSKATYTISFASAIRVIQ